MDSRSRIKAAVNHETTDKLPIDFGGGFQTGIHASVVYQLRQRLGLDAPGTPVKVVDVYQMLGEIKPDLQDALEIDTVSLHGTGTMFGFPSVEFKEWKLHDGTPLLVPVDFNTHCAPNGDLLQYPEGDMSADPSGRMPAGGFFFDAILRQEPLEESRLNPGDNMEEFKQYEDERLSEFIRQSKVPWRGIVLRPTVQAFHNDNIDCIPLHDAGEDRIKTDRWVGTFSLDRLYLPGVHDL